MYNDGRRVFFGKPIGDYLKDQGSPTGKAFMEGCRAMLDAFRTLDPQEYRGALSNKGTHHIIALLTRSEQKRIASQCADAQSLLDYYYRWKLSEAISFIFNVPAIDYDTGVALDENGEPIEDKSFVPLPGTGQSVCPRHSITRDVDGSSIGIKEYLELDPHTRSCDYSYRRLLTLTSADDSAITIDSDNPYFVEELIRRLINRDIPGINARFLAMIDAERDERNDGLGRSLYEYRGMIKELLCSRPMRPHGVSLPVEPLHEAEFGPKTRGQIIIAQLEKIANYDCENTLRDWRNVLPMSNITNCYDVIMCCKRNTDDRLGELITTDDITNYRSVNGELLITNSFGEKLPPTIGLHNFKTYFIPSVCKKMLKILRQIVVDTSPDDITLTPNERRVLERIKHCLKEYYDVKTNDELWLLE